MAESMSLLDPPEPFCRACGALSPAGCGWDVGRELADLPPGWRKRPAECPNAYDPATSPWPDGF